MSNKMRGIVKLAAVAALALVLVGFWSQNAGATQKQPDYPGRGHFRVECEAGGGVFVDTGDGNLWCQYPDGAVTVCDSNGKDCWHIPKPVQESGPQAPTTGTAADAGSPVVGGHTVDTTGPVGGATRQGR